jgi:hypothetical protein
MSSIYVTSKHSHVELWRHYRHRGHNIVSSWIDLEEAIDTEIVGQRYWPIWMQEAHEAEYLVFYAAPGETSHHGSLLEIASCLIGGGTILHVGVSETMKTSNGQLADFTYHPRWKRVAGLEKAFEIIQNPTLLLQ